MIRYGSKPDPLRQASVEDQKIERGRGLLAAEAAATEFTPSRSENVPLVVDLDGTLLRTDLLFESVLRLVKQKPWLTPLIPFWLLRGRAHLKRKISQLIRVDVSLLPLHDEVLAWLRDEKARGRRLVLATASDHEQACSVVQPLRLFDTVLGSDGQRNLKGQHKLGKIVETCGEKFDYAGNSRSDLAIWRGCQAAVVVNAPGRLESAARHTANVVRVFPRSFSALREALHAMRCHQWVKNLLVFVPAITSHTIFEAPVAAKAALAFVSFGFCASAAYILNDLLDLEDDRRHPTNKKRPFASGRMSIGSGILLAIGCVAASAATASFISRSLVAALIIYLALTSLYSFYLKRMVVLDVLILALLYTLRVVAGSVATGIVLSPWLLSFAFFLFLGLAFSKRAADLVQHRQNGRNVLPGRGYLTIDLDAVCIAGMCSGFLSALVLALYISSDSVQWLYRRPALLWGLQPILLYYLTRLWIVCRRGELTEDPIAYAFREPSTYGAAALAVAVLLAATFDLRLFAL
jgi:4-hydroxybenzoate polyprenyltransferase